MKMKIRNLGQQDGSVGKALAAKPDNLSSLLDPHGGKRTDSQKLSSDLHRYVVHAPHSAQQ